MTIRPIRLNHLNIVVEDYPAAVSRLVELFDGELLLDLPQAEWNAGLVDVGRTIFELFAPPSFLLNARYGPHYLGLEYQADMAQVRDTIAAHGVRIARDIGVALHTHPADSLGIAFEFYDGSFHDNIWPLVGRAMRPASYWRKKDGAGFTGRTRHTVAVEAIDPARRFVESFLGAELLYEVDRPALGARAWGFRVADTVMELQAASRDGPLEWHLRRWGEGIRSTVFEVIDLDRARGYFEARSTRIMDGPKDSFTLDEFANLGAIFEFTASSHLTEIVKEN